VLEFARCNNATVFYFINQAVRCGGGIAMFDTDVTTTEVVVMYAIAFGFFFGLAAALLKKNS
jgi:hypothetical protein